jgi:hypothetical protein
MSYLCPACKKKLLWGGSLSYQTLPEHVSNPNYDPPPRSFYYCDNILCDANASQEINKRCVITEKTVRTEPNNIIMFWDEYGDLYGGFRSNIKFIGENNSPFGSDARRQNIEIRKRDENFKIIEIFGWRFNSEYSYKADTDGNILKRKMRITIWKKDKNGGYIHFISGWRMFMFLMKMFKKNYSNFKTNNSTYSRGKLMELFFPEYYIKPYKKAFALYLSVFYPRLKKMLINPE